MAGSKGKLEKQDTPGKQVLRLVIEAPIDVVWSTLVKTDAVLPFFFGAVCDAGPKGLSAGTSMRMVSADRRFAIVVGDVLEFSPPHRYVHTIGFTQSAAEQPAHVAYDLKEVAGGTEVTLTSTFLAGSKTGKMVQGGAFIVQNLKAVAETGKPAFSGAMVLALNPLMGLATPKISRIENWPYGQMTGSPQAIKLTETSRG